MKVLSLTQPWAWLVIHGGKSIENRTWNTHYRGRFLVHAAKGMTRAEYYDAVSFAQATKGVHAAARIPAAGRLERGGIVGAVTLTGVLPPTGSPVHPWHMRGRFGFVLADPRPLPFHACSGVRGFWDYSILDQIELRP